MILPESWITLLILAVLSILELKKVVWFTSRNKAGFVSDVNEVVVTPTCRGQSNRGWWRDEFNDDDI
jgi:hypothetical protein